MTQLPKIVFNLRYFVHKFQDGKGRIASLHILSIWDKLFSYSNLILLQLLLTHDSLISHTIADICLWITPLFQITVEFSCKFQLRRIKNC